MTISIDSTYSVDDNKLRLYASERLDSELYARVKEAGFKWAPRQELFVAPKWTPEREDLCIELAGEITAEQTTLIERAEAKAERLDSLSAKRQRQSNSFHEAANRLSERFAFGQPILVGHHSERRARKDQERMHAHMDKAVKAGNAVGYWADRAEGVERHANRKGNPAVRARRVKTLLKELRDWQRRVNHAYICVELWGKVNDIEDTEQFKKAAEHWAGARLKTGGTCRYDSWSELTDGKLDHRVFVTDTLEAWTKSTQSPTKYRWISHILNRLDFERSELGDVPRYEGEITGPLLQTFAREHGAHKPRAFKKDSGNWVLESSVQLPAHVADGYRVDADLSGWRDLMQSCGYVVPEKKERRKKTSVSVPLINPTVEDAERLQERWNTEAINKYNAKYPGNADRPGCAMKVAGIRKMSQARYSANSNGSYTPFETIELDEYGNRIWSSYKGKSAEPVYRVRTFSGGDTSLYAPRCIVVVEDKPMKPFPISWDNEKQEAVN